MESKTEIEAVRELLKNKNFEKVLSILTEVVLLEKQDADLYVLKSEALWKLDRFEEYNVAIDSALAINSIHPIANFLKAGDCWRKKDYERAIHHYEIAIKYDPKNLAAHIRLGGAYLEFDEYDKAKGCFIEAIKINSKSQIAYEGLGRAYRGIGDIEQSIECYKKSLEINPSTGGGYLGLASLYFSLNQYDESIAALTEQLKIKPNLRSAYFNRSLSYRHIGKYEAALADLEMVLAISPEAESDDYLVSRSESLITSLKKTISNTFYNEVLELVYKIKDLLLYEEPCVTHYTSLSVAESLILDRSLLRLSEGAFLNDTSEGKELFKHLPALDLSVPSNETDTVAQPFTQRPFIGSYVAESKHDDLTMWRMYGKEKMIEARGCAVTINRTTFLKKVIDSLVTDTSREDDMFEPDLVMGENEFEFYRVAYQTVNKDFVIPGAKRHSQTRLNKTMKQLCETLSRFNLSKTNSPKDVQNIKQLLNEIAFLFKSGEYQYEHEIRLVLTGEGLKKKVVNKIDGQKIFPPRVYIELVDISSVIEKITLGPKVENAEEWAASFFYSLFERGYSPKILISHLPFK